MTHIALIGDSIFDNAAYTNGGPALIDHIRRLLPTNTTADLLAKDGALISDVKAQLENLRPEHTQLVLSVGGNNALLNAGVLDLHVASSGEAYFHLETVVDEFEAAYRNLIEECMQLKRPLCVCTIYEGSFDDLVYQKIVKLALRAFNDAIQMVAHDHCLPVIELRRVCTRAEDYANPIEPSVIGGEKIARAILKTLL